MKVTNQFEVGILLGQVGLVHCMLWGEVAPDACLIDIEILQQYVF